MGHHCLLPYTGEGFYPAALAEPLSCVIGAMHAYYHLSPGSLGHKVGIVGGGKAAKHVGAPDRVC